MNRLTRALAYLVCGLSGCASQLPVDGSECPCPMALGYVCCPSTSRCISPGQTCGAAADGGSPEGPPASVEQLQTFVSIGIGDAHACGVRVNGSISCMGSNAKGQATPPPGKFQEIVTGAAHNCAQLKEPEVTAADGGLDGGNGGAPINPPWVCWGDNTYGQTTLPWPDVVVTAAGDKHTCGYTFITTAAGSVINFVCWGDNSFGQATAPAVQLWNVTAGRNHTCGVGPSLTGTKQELFCWGDNSRGQVTPPVGLPLDSIEGVVAGGNHTCIVNQAHEISCWGDDAAGLSTPPRRWLQPFGITTGHACGIDLQSDNSNLVCWGNGWDGALSTPPDGAFRGVSVGKYRTCVTPYELGHPAICWGSTYEAWY